MTPTIDVRRMLPSELPDVIELVLALMREEGWPIAEDTQGSIAISLIDWENAPVWVACDGEALVGMIQLKVAHDVTTGLRLDAFRLYVRPEYRNQGVGRALIAGVIDALPPDLEVNIYISTVGPLRRSFKRLGFDTVSQIHVAPLSTVRAALGR